MNIYLSRASGSLYKNIAKPIFFKQSPDNVHSRLVKVGALLQRSTFIRRSLNKTWAYHNKTALSQKVNGLTFSNPVGLSAGFDKNFELLPIIKSIGFGFMEGGSLTLHKCAGNPRPWFYRLPKTKSLVVHVGLANKGVDTIIQTLKSYRKSTFNNFPLNISVAKTNSKEACDEIEAIADYVGSLAKLEEAGLGDIYTLNISCPNTYGGEPFNTPKRLNRLLEATDQLSLSKPLYIKMPSDLAWPEFKQLVKVADKHKVDGLTISNLAKDRSKVALKDPLPKHIEGNLSGLPTQALSDNLIKETYRAYKGRFVIVGVGGIFTAEDAYRKIKYGANLVELITGMIFNGPQLAGKINYDIVQLLKKDGYTNISQAVGSGNLDSD